MTLGILALHLGFNLPLANGSCMAIDCIFWHHLLDSHSSPQEVQGFVPNEIVCAVLNIESRPAAHQEATLQIGVDHRPMLSKRCRKVLARSSGQPWSRFSPGTHATENKRNSNEGKHVT
jgi:hypothetical protein